MGKREKDKKREKNQWKRERKIRRENIERYEYRSIATTASQCVENGRLWPKYSAGVGGAGLQQSSRIGSGGITVWVCVGVFEGECAWADKGAWAWVQRKRATEWRWA